MERRVITTADGSVTVQIPSLNISYHSNHGAIQESLHVFINAGLSYYASKYPLTKDISVFEMGFGTGLNALLTCLHTAEKHLNINYEAIELHPLSEEEIDALNYGSLLNADALLQQIHGARWNRPETITDSFTLTKLRGSIQQYQGEQLFHLIYFDAFAPNVQPELWTEDQFRKLHAMLHPSGILLTYCSKSVVRKAMQAAGFSIEKIPGPRGKREMVRATR